MLYAGILLSLIVGCSESQDHAPTVDVQVGVELSSVSGVSAIRLAVKQQSTRSAGYSNPATGTGSLGTALMTLCPNHFDLPMNEAIKINQLYPYHFEWSVAGDSKAERFDKFREFLAKEFELTVTVRKVIRDGYELYVLDENVLKRHQDNAAQEQRDRFTDTGIQFTGYTMDELAKNFTFNGNFPCASAVPGDATYSFHMIDYGGYDPSGPLAASLKPIGLGLRPAQVSQTVVSVSGEGIVDPNIGELPEIEVLDPDGEPGGFGGTGARLKQE